ncbi:hypothetical protein X975_26046, partial [Stegodyphus mimosarum]
MDIEPGKEGGTWLAMKKNGKIGALLNILQPDNEIFPDKKGRGFLAVDYVVGQKECFSYLHDISLEKENYNGFLLVLMDLSCFKTPQIAYFTNASSRPPVTVGPGIHAFGNSITPETPWPKVTKAKEKFTEVVKKNPSVATKDVLVDELFALLCDRSCYSLDENMKKQGKSKTSMFLDKLSAIFVNIPESNYGSRCHTVILIDGSKNVDYFERSRNEKLPPEVDEEWILSHYNFKLS